MSNKKSQIYLDYAATTPVDERVIKIMLPFFNKKFGNPASIHSFGQTAEAELTAQRAKFATAINARPEEIYFTSSATESNNLVLKGLSMANRDRGNHLIISAIEHDCVFESAKWLSQNGFEISIAPVDQFGQIKFNELAKLITPKTILVSIIHASNEIGTLQDLKKIGQLCKKNNIYFHTDTAQSFGKIALDVKKLNIDLLTASSHKIYGPKGVGLLYKKAGIKIQPLLHGGGQENGLRSSTVNVAGIVGFGKALELCLTEQTKESQRQIKLRDYLIKNILIKIPGSHLNGHPTNRLSNNINLRFDKIEGESIAMLLNEEGIAVSTGSACSSNKLEPSRVLLATGLEPAKVHGSLRISLGRWTTKSDLDYLIKKLIPIIKQLRAISPF
ncbi:MAG: cysteine desulfurase family protein [Patescibacteria group bacterium]